MKEKSFKSLSGGDDGFSRYTASLPITIRSIMSGPESFSKPKRSSQAAHSVLAAAPPRHQPPASQAEWHQSSSSSASTY